MDNYTADDGLKVLDYLEIKITESEVLVFKSEWNKNYKKRNYDLIGTVWELYQEVLPFTCGDVDRGSFILSKFRDRNFSERLKRTKLDEKLKQGKSLNEIISEQ